MQFSTSLRPHRWCARQPARCPQGRNRARVSSALQASAESVKLKANLMDALEIVNRGIFGVRKQEQAAIHETIEAIEKLNALPNPTENLEHLNGSWRVIYSTIRIMGTKRSKLGLREFVKLGEIHQDIDVQAKTAIQRVAFSVSGFGLISGEFRIDATFKPSSSKRVEVSFVNSELKPVQLQKLFELSYDMLLSIFNPEGYLDITYVDDNFRIGRDGRDNIFVLERVEASKP